MSSLLQRVKDRILPIRRDEVLKFLVLSSIFFFICLNNHVLRNLKETIIITKPELGISAIPFIKTWMMFPVILFFVNAYVFLSARFKQSTVTYIILSTILTYFVSFIYILYPNEQSLRFDSLADWIAVNTSYNTLSEIIRHWFLSLYYCMSEIWGTIVLMILFWGTCNRSTELEQAKRFYSPILFISNLSGFAAAQVSIYSSQTDFKYLFFPSSSNWDATLSSLTLLVCVLTGVILGLFYFLNTNILKGKEFRETTNSRLEKKSMSLMSIIKYIAANVKFRPLALMIFAYYFCSGILELILKYYLHTVYTSSNDFNDVLNQMTIYISLASMLVTVFITGNLIKRFPWQISAVITPLLLIIPLSLLILNFFFQTDSATALTVSTILCAIYFMLSRMCKFTFFDLSKEVASVEFTYEEQIKSKTVLDGVIPKTAKTSESLFLQILVVAFTDFDLMIPFIVLFIFGIHLLWIYTIPIFKKKTPSVLLQETILQQT